jgi:5-methylcytosine-specific restriction endonuclease McrA
VSKKQQRQKPLRSKKHLRPISDKRRAEREAEKEAQGPLARAWWEAVAKGKSCAVCGRPDRVQGHHVVARQVLRRMAKRYGYDLLRLLWDPRNGVAVCERCHDAHTTARRRIPRWAIPASAFAFAAEYGLSYVLEREYPDEPGGGPG